MKLVEINWKPSDRQLRQFGVICLFALPLVGWIWGASTMTVGILSAVGLLLAIAGFILPKTVAPIFLALTIVTMPIGMAISEVAMLLIFFGLFLPMGLVFRLINRDALQMKIDRNSKSYWQTKKQPSSVEEYYRQS